MGRRRLSWWYPAVFLVLLALAAILKQRLPQSWVSWPLVAVWPQTLSNPENPRITNCRHAYLKFPETQR
eukprot:6327422-Amphidinium_carterae.1